MNNFQCIQILAFLMENNDALLRKIVTFGFMTVHLSHSKVRFYNKNIPNTCHIKQQLHVYNIAQSSERFCPSYPLIECGNVCKLFTNIFICNFLLQQFTLSQWDTGNIIQKTYALPIQINHILLSNLHVFTTFLEDFLW